MASSVPVAGVQPAAGSFDPLRDKSYRDTLLGPDVVAWLAWMDLGGAADRTLDEYERGLARLCTMYPAHRLEQLTDVELAHVLRSWPKGSHHARKGAFASFFKWAIRTRRIRENPIDLLPDMKRRGQRYIDMFSETEGDDLLSLGVLDAPLMMILLDTGLRKSEARALQVRRIKLDVRELVVIGGKGGKAG